MGTVYLICDKKGKPIKAAQQDVLKVGINKYKHSGRELLSVTTFHKDILVIVFFVIPTKLNDKGRSTDNKLAPASRSLESCTD